MPYYSKHSRISHKQDDYKYADNYRSKFNNKSYEERRLVNHRDRSLDHEKDYKYSRNNKDDNYHNFNKKDTRRNHSKSFSESRYDYSNKYNDRKKNYKNDKYDKKVKTNNKNHDSPYERNSVSISKDSYTNNKKKNSYTLKTESVKSFVSRE
ncbi:hypothetical protein PFDG_05506 [Plasmodium falciparum Dd2]|nr:hypothetical protein PFDG_05506 [Plasmodium falciparum Dd2]